MHRRADSTLDGTVGVIASYHRVLGLSARVIEPLYIAILAAAFAQHVLVSNSRNLAGASPRTIIINLLILVLCLQSHLLC
jgi:hypothetical protein